MTHNTQLAAVIGSVRPALNAQPTTEAERSRFLYDLVREVYDHTKFDLHEPTDDTDERTRIGVVLDAALPVIERQGALDELRETLAKHDTQLRCVRGGIENVSVEGIRGITRIIQDRGARHAEPTADQRPRVAVRVVDGDILTMSADAIVNPWNRNYWPRKILAPGGLSGQIKERTTDEPWRQLAKFGMLPTGDVVVTGSGGLTGYGYIFHAIGLTFNWKATPEGVTECARNVVRRAVELGVRSVTVPLIGAGTGKLAAAESEAAILAGLSDAGRVVSGGDSADIEVTVVRYTADR